MALARALLQRPALLILDDSLSAVDPDTEASILEALAARTQEQSAIVIAHRVSTVRHADKVLVLNEGRIVEAGTPEELLGVDGPFRRLWEAQTSLSEDPEPALAGSEREDA
ncbi:MAG: ABC transporter ATP-binding protein [Planctomycetota bacterium]